MYVLFNAIKLNTLDEQIMLIKLRFNKKTEIK